MTDDDSPADGLPSYRGALVRYTPDSTAKDCLSKETDAEKWCTLNSGTHEYLKLGTDGTFEWVSSLEDSNPALYGGSEGLHVQDGVLTFVTIVDKLMFRLDLDGKTYTKKSVPFTQEPDNIRILDDTLYLCTDGDHDPDDGVWGWNDNGAFKVFYEVRWLKCSVPSVQQHHIKLTDTIFAFFIHFPGKPQLPGGCRIFS